MGTRCADHATPLYPQKLALTSPTGGGRSVGMVRSRTKATEFLGTIHTGAPYDRIRNIAPLYTILRTSCLSPQLIFAALKAANNLYAFPHNLVYMLVEVTSSVDGDA